MRKVNLKRSIAVISFVLMMFLYSHLVSISLDGPQQPFVSDGCSMWPDNIHGECCLVHDQAYWVGGTPEDRVKADNEFRQCVAEIPLPYVPQVTPYVAGAMYYSVRVGGHPVLPFPWRWDFGQPYRFGYRD